MKRSRLQKLYDKIADKQSLFTMQICLTENCNQNCVHCLVDRKKSRSMTPVTAKDILRQAKKLGCMNVSFTGGEVFGVRYFKDILEYADGLGFRIMIYSNGTLIDDKMLRFLKKIKFLNIQLSLFAAEPECHDKITGEKGSFDALYRTARGLRKNRINFYFVMSAMRQNFSQLKKVVNIARQEKWTVYYNFLIFPPRANPEEVYKYRINNEQIRDAYRLGIFPFAKEKRNFAYSDKKLFHARSLGKYHVYVNASGEVFPGIKLPIKVGDLKENSLSEIWHNSKELNRLRSIALDDFECFECEHKIQCTWSPSLAYMENGDLLKKPQELCRFTKVSLEHAS